MVLASRIRRKEFKLMKKKVSMEVAFTSFTVPPDLKESLIDMSLYTLMFMQYSDIMYRISWSTEESSTRMSLSSSNFSVLGR